jgi:thioredoxin 1
MASPATLEFSDSNFDAEVLKSNVPVLVDFWAEWCQPCRMLGPTIDDLAKEFQGRAKVGKVDVDSSRDVAFKYEVMNIPTVIIFKNGQAKKRFVGLTNKNDLRAAIDDAMKA